MTFKEENRTLQELVRELVLVRAHNLREARKSQSQQHLLFFAEAALVLMCLERFLRILPGVDPADTDTLPKLLRKAVIEKSVLILPVDDIEKAIKQITRVRNTTLHANYEQAARECGLKSVEEYFKTMFISEVEALTKLTNNLIAQIDSKTGKRCNK